MCVSTITKKKDLGTLNWNTFQHMKIAGTSSILSVVRSRLSLVHTCVTRHDTTRQHATRHDRGPRHDDFLVWCHTYHDTTMPLDSDSLQTPWQFRGVQLITRLFTRG